MSISEIKGSVVPVKLWTPLDGVESGALDQLRKVASLPWVAHHVAVMPDVHVGKGATVGSVIAMRGALAPATVGVDIGCGMGAIRTSLRASDLPDNLKSIRLELERRIPVGFNEHDEPVIKRSNLLFREFPELHRGVQDLELKARKQCGTLGGGNHFIELCLDEGERCEACEGTGWLPGCEECEGPCECDSGRMEPRVWLMLHSGSRNIGKTLAEIHMNVARKLAHNAELPDRDLAVFLAGTPEMEAYRRDLFWAQRYAFENRREMIKLCKKVIDEAFPSHDIQYDAPILCHHNYVAEEIHYGEELVITRKGAISAQAGELGIIPGSMGTKSYIVEGLGNTESFCSASHGAGRRMSRGAAKRHFEAHYGSTTEAVVQQTMGVECRKDGDIVDEVPGAYKDIEQVMANQSDLVAVRHVLKQVLCVKG